MNSSIVVHRGNQLQPDWPLPQPPLAPQTDDRLDLRAIYFALRRQRYLILITALTFVALAMAFTAMQTQKYMATSRVVLNSTDDRIAPRSDSNSVAPRDSDFVDTEVEVIRSNELALSVARSLRLDQNEFFHSTSAQPAGLRQRLKRMLGMGENAQTVPASREAVLRGIAESLQSSLSVERIGTTHAFMISITSVDPVIAQMIANEYASQYTLMYLNQKRASGAAAAAMLLSRLEELRQQAQADTAKVQQYRIANNLLSTTGASLSEQEISSYNQEVATTRAQSAADRAQLSTARAQLRAGSAGDDVGEALSSPVVSALRARRAETASRVAALETQFGPAYPPLQSARGELAEVDAQIASEIKRIISNLEAQVDISSGRLASIQGSLGAAKGNLAANNQAMVGLDDLTRRAEASQQLYDSYLAEYKQTIASQGTERPDARVISYAALPDAPFSPKPVLNIVLALVVGTGVGVAIGLIREMLYAGLSTQSDVEQKLSVRCLGSIPLVSSILPNERSPIAALSHAPKSGYAEAYRSVRTSIKHALPSSSQILMITSTLPSEGKTTLSAGIAKVSAMGGESVVLVDVDKRRRGASQFVAKANLSVGLLECLRGTATLEEALIVDESSGASILPIAGDAAGLDDLIAGGEMTQLLARLRERFNLVLLDAPPILPFAYTRSLATKVTGVVMVTKWRSTPDRAVRAALSLLPEGEVRIAGVVLSQVNMRQQAHFGHGEVSAYYKEFEKYYA